MQQNARKVKQPEKWIECVNHFKSDLDKTIVSQLSLFKDITNKNEVKNFCPKLLLVLQQQLRDFFMPSLSEDCGSA